MDKPKGEIIRHCDLTQSSAFVGAPVDILIPFHAHGDYVARLVESLYRTIKKNKYLITLIDDASPDKKFIHTLSRLPRLQTLQHDQQLGFGAALATGFKETKHPFVLFLHSDVKAENVDWLCNLGNSLLELETQKVVMVSARTNNPGEDADECLKSSKHEVGPNVVLEEGHLPLFCTLSKRALFAEIGFVKPYPLRGYEDVEMAWRLRSRGFRQAVCGRSWVYHQGGVTFNALKGDTASVLEQNRQQCILDMKSVKKPTGVNK